MSDLESCPFCGSNNIRPAIPGILYAECQECGAFGPSVQAVGMHIPHPCEANDLWNTRAKSEAEELLELLHERRGSLHCYAASRCVVDYPDSDYVTERDNPLDALRAAREASDE